MSGPRYPLLTSSDPSLPNYSRMAARARLRARGAAHCLQPRRECGRFYLDPKRARIEAQAGKPSPIGVCHMEKQAAKQSKEKLDKVTKTDAEWRQQLSDEEYQVTRKKGT